MQKSTTTELPIVTIVGRVNVGKSTLFNRLIEDNKAIVSEIAGTTRTNNEGDVLWRGKYFRLIDTGGLTFDEKVLFEKEIRDQSEKGIAKANLVLFVTDAQVGILPQEREMAKILRSKKVPVILLANKMDNVRVETAMDVPDWLALGLGEPFLVSAASGRSTGDLLDLVYTHLAKGKKRPKNEKDSTNERIRISIIGKPNAGKSSLFNKIIGEEKVIVSPIPHTTREPHNTDVDYAYEEDGKQKTLPITFVDTAGIRRKSRVEGELETKGISKSLVSVEHSDLILFVLDGSEQISSQDMQLGGLLERHAKSVIIILNKWDLSADNSDQKRNEVKKHLYACFPHISYAPIIFTSAKSGYKVHNIYPTIAQVWEARHTEIPQETLSIFLKGIIQKHAPMRGKGTRYPEILGMRQLGTCPPVFEMFIKQKTSLSMAYVHYVENKMREQFNFFGTPVLIKLSKMKK